MQSNLIELRRNCIKYNRYCNHSLIQDEFGGYILFQEYLDQVESLRRFMLSMVQMERREGVRSKKHVEQDTNMFFSCFKDILAFFVDSDYPKLRTKASDFGVVRDMVGRFVKMRNMAQQYFQPASSSSFRKSFEDLIADRILQSEALCEEESG